MGQWSQIVSPIVAKFNVGAKFGDVVTFNPDGADAMGKLIKQMAEKLDYAIEHPFLAMIGNRLTRMS